MAASIIAPSSASAAVPFFDLNARYAVAEGAKPRDLISDAYCLGDCAAAVLEGVCERLPVPKLLGVLFIVRQANEEEQLRDSLGLLRTAINVLDEAAGDIDDRALWGALYLLQQALAAKHMAYRLN